MLNAAFLLSIPLSFIFGAVNFAAFYLVAPPRELLEELSQEHDGLGPLKQILNYRVTWYFFVAGWAVLYVALSYAARVRQAERSIAAYRAAAQSAQLRALRYQITAPRFLFNTPNSLSALVMRNRNQEADRMIMNLWTFFRTSLTSEPTDDISLADEIGMQRPYLHIEQVRFPERLVVEIDVPKELERARLPSMILQPLVENAVKHGVTRATASAKVAITARTKDDALQLVVENDANNPADAASGSGVGLNNVAERLATRFGSAARRSANPRPCGGYRVELTIPLQRNA